MGIFKRTASNFRSPLTYVELPPIPSAPSSKGFEGSTITFDGSQLQRLPSPVHVWQAPNGLLNENDRGSNCGTLDPHSGHASFCEYKRSGPSTCATSTSPPASLVAVSIDASSRFSTSGLISSRSTTTSMV